MASDGDAPMSNNKLHVPDEILQSIFSHLSLPPAMIIGQQRYDVPRGPIIQDGTIKGYSDDGLHRVACPHQHEEWKLRLRTLSAITLASRHFKEVAVPILYQIYPGQTLAKPLLFIRSLKEVPALSPLVKELVLDPLELFNTDHEFTAAFVNLLVRSPDFPSLPNLERSAKMWDDEARALLLLFHCPSVHTLALTRPDGYTGSTEAATSPLFNGLRYLGPNTLARTPEDTNDPSNTGTEDSISPPCRPPLRSQTRRTNPAPAPPNPPISDDASILSRQRSFSNILRRCKELRSLNIIFARCKATEEMSELEAVAIDFRDLGTVIRTRLAKLKNLRLDDREMNAPLPTHLGSFKDSPTELEELAVDARCLGSHTIPGQTDVPTPLLADMLPPTLKTLVIFRNNLWWHRSDCGSEANALTQDDVTFRFDAMQKKVAKMLRSDRGKVPMLESIHIDTPQKLMGNVEAYGWACERVFGDEMLVRPSTVTGSLMKVEKERSWYITQNERAVKPSGLLWRNS